jgi:hypothetical protein
MGRYLDILAATDDEAASCPTIEEELRAKARSLQTYLDNQSIPLAERQRQVPMFERMLDQISAETELGTVRTLDRVGWTPIQSEILGETIVAVCDDHTVVPQPYTTLVRYTQKEIDKLDGLDDEQIRDVHRVKKAFLGKVVGRRETKNMKNPGELDGQRDYIGG